MNSEKSIFVLRLGQSESLKVNISLNEGIFWNKSKIITQEQKHNVITVNSSWNCKSPKSNIGNEKKNSKEERKKEMKKAKGVEGDSWVNVQEVTQRLQKHVQQKH